MDTKNILIVDDEKEFVEMLSEKVTKEGFTVFSAPNGKIALETVKKNKIDLIILDLLMPEMDGISFCYHLRNEMQQNIPVIVLTNFAKTSYPTNIKSFLVKTNTTLDQVMDEVKKQI